jgi:hypothetical protein
MFSVWLSFSFYIQALVYILMSFNDDMGYNEDEAEWSSMVIRIAFFAGVAFGAGVINWISNNHGRKLALILS